MEQQLPKKRGRPPIGDRAMTEAEKKRRQRAIKKQQDQTLAKPGVFIRLPVETLDELDKMAAFWGLKNRAELVQDLLAFQLRFLVMNKESRFEREYAKSFFEFNQNLFAEMGDSDGMKTREKMRRFWKALMIPELKGDALITSQGISEFLKSLTLRDGGSGNDPIN